MRAKLSIYPLTTTETQLDFSGTYEPPLGVLGGAFDAIVSHRIAEASCIGLCPTVAGHLRTALEQASLGTFKAEMWLLRGRVELKNKLSFSIPI